MLEQNDIETVARLQRQAFELFSWLDEALAHGRIELSASHRGLTPPDAARAWLVRNRASVPPELRVDDADLAAFANLFASFLRVSFEPHAGGELLAGCDCGFCAVFAKGHFRPRRLTKKQRAGGVAFKLHCLVQLSLELGHPRTEAEVGALEGLEPAATLFAYGCDLLRRARYESNGPTGLALWRQLPKDARKRLDGARFLEAEAALTRRLAAVTVAR